MMYFTRKGSDARIKVPTAFNYKKAGHTTTSKDSLLTIMNRTTASNYVSPLVAQNHMPESKLGTLSKFWKESGQAGAHRFDDSVKVNAKLSVLQPDIQKKTLARREKEQEAQQLIMKMNFSDNGHEVKKDKIIQLIGIIAGAN